MGILRLTIFTVGAMGVAMMHFGRDEGLPADRIGQEPTIAQETIQQVSAPAVANETVATEVVATMNAEAVTAPATHTPSAGLMVVPVALTSSDAPLTAAEKAEAAARLMASSVTSTKPAVSAQDTSSDNYLYVSGTTVNMRAGPSTSFGVVSKLTRGTEVINMGDAGDGWSQIKVVDTGARGFMASKFLTSQL